MVYIWNELKRIIIVLLRLPKGRRQLPCPVADSSVKEQIVENQNTVHSGGEFKCPACGSKGCLEAPPAAMSSLSDSSVNIIT